MHLCCRVIERRVIVKEFIAVLSFMTTIVAVIAGYIVRPYIQNDREKTKITLERMAFLSSDVDSLRVELRNLTESVSRLHALLCREFTCFSHDGKFIYSEKGRVS